MEFLIEVILIIDYKMTPKFLEYDTLEEVEVSIFNRLKTYVIEDTMIDGGHYIFEKGEIGSPDEISLLTFRIAIKLYEWGIKKKKNIKIGFFVDDFSFPVEKRIEFKREGFSFPEQYKKLLRKVPEEDIILFFESRERNHAGRKLKRCKEEGKITKIGNSYRVNIKETDISYQVSSNRKDGCIIAVCRMLLAQLLYDRMNMGYKRVINLYNQAMFKCKGTFVDIFYELYDKKIDIVNIYFESNNNKFLIDEKYYIYPKI
ncbi:MAG: hypothetical protein KAT28_01245 [Candidatus Aenigmarchaeota archaeon]|nr:hypothetical protein [Candidatus Aenigmarchaeota archaeon]